MNPPIDMPPSTQRSAPSESSSSTTVVGEVVERVRAYAVRGARAMVEGDTR